MTQSQDNYNLLIEKLDGFIRKYYLNQIIKGSIYVMAVLLFSFLLVTALEHFGKFTPTVRTVLFYAFVLTNLAILVKYVAIPLVKLFKLGKTISHEQAAQIIGKHFTNVKDKLLNTLQLRHQASQQTDEFRRELIEASIRQKTTELKPVPFTSAVDYGSNRKYLKYALIPLVVLAILLFRSPDMILGSSERLIQHQRYFEPVAPFKFVLANDTLTAIRQEDFTLKLKFEGEEIPAEAYVLSNGRQLRMSRKNNINYEYTLNNLQDNLTFQFGADGFISKPYTLKVLPRPVLQGFSIKLDYPDYTGKKDETVKNIGDLTVPAGTKATWSFNTEYTSDINMMFKDTVLSAGRTGENTFSFTKRFYDNTRYYIKPGNSYLSGSDSILYYVNVVPDAYPSIVVQEEKDTASTKRLFFNGELSDDYGLSRLVFVHTPIVKGKPAGEPKVKELGLQKGKAMQAFFHFWDIGELGIKAGDEFEYYFEVWDNDQVNGRKSSRSQKFHFKAPTEEELQKKLESNTDELKSEMQDALKKASELQKEFKDARQKMMEKKNLSWEDKKNMESLLQKQQDLQQNLKQLSEKFDKTRKEQKDYKEINPELEKKHEQLQKMMEELMTEEMKKMLDEMQKLMEENMKDQLDKKMEDMDKDNSKLEKELDRMLELFKRMELEQKMLQTQEKLDKLSEEQKKLAEETEKTKEKDSEKTEELKKKQEELNKKFDDVKKDLEDIKKKNDELQNPEKMEDFDKDAEEVEQNMKEGLEQMEQQQNKKSSQKQKKASDKMKEMSQKMKDMQMSMEMESLQEDYKALRQLLNNIIHLSFEQEKLMNKLGEIQRYNPQYVELAQQQRKLKEDAQIVEDSLMALAKRVFQIQSFVTREMNDVNYYFEKTIKDMSDRNIPAARKDQQYIMTGLNNLAVMLSEVMEQMQQQMAQSMPGNRMCNNPKPGQGQKPSQSLKSMKEMQEQLNQQMEEMKKGNKEGGDKGTSEKLARMAAQQEQLRQALRELEQQKKKDGKGSQGQLDELQRLMEETEKDLYNKQLNEETLKRQKEILVKLLEAEKSEREQDFKEERESKTAQEQTNPHNAVLEEYRRRKMKEVELLQTVPPGLNSYYREKVKDYFQKIR